MWEDWRLQAWMMKHDWKSCFEFIMFIFCFDENVYFCAADLTGERTDHENPIDHMNNFYIYGQKFPHLNNLIYGPKKEEGEEKQLQRVMGWPIGTFQVDLLNAH